MATMVEEGDQVEARTDFWFGPLSGQNYTVKAGTMGLVRRVSVSASRRVADVVFDGTDDCARLIVDAPGSLVEVHRG